MESNILHISSAEEAAAAFAALEKPGVPSFFELSAQLPSIGRTDRPVAATPMMSVMLKCYAEGGENTLHAHVNEDHVFVVLQGAADFFGPKGEIKSIARNQGVVLPRGTYYRFVSRVEEPLVMIRIGCKTAPDVDVHERIGSDGQPMAGNSKENMQVDPVLSNFWFGKG